MNRVILDVIQLTFMIPATLTDDVVWDIRRVLHRGGFLPRLRQLILSLMREYPELKRVQMRLSR